MRYHRMGRLPPRPEGPSGRPRRDDGLVGSARTGRPRGLDRPARGDRAPTAGRDRPRRRRPADGGRGRRRPRRADLQRGDLQLRRPAPGTGRPRAPLPDPVGHRGGAPGLPRVGSGLPAPVRRHVRLRGLGRADRHLVPGPGPARRQTALLPPVRPRPGLRLRAQGPAGQPGVRRRPRRCRPDQAVRDVRHPSTRSRGAARTLRGPSRLVGHLQPVRRRARTSTGPSPPPITSRTGRRPSPTSGRCWTTSSASN